MKKRRKLTTKRARENTQQAGVEQEHGASISVLPGQILMNILSRLSVKSIFRCRCVSKLWLNLLLDPEFAKLHFSRAPTCPLLRDSGDQRLSRALYLVEFERDSICDVCGYSCDIKDHHFDFHSERYYERNLHVKMKLRTIFMLPERECGSKTKIFERKFNIVNSCNGLLCLRGCRDSEIYPVVIYNPVTGEYSVLPRPDFNDKEVGATVCGLGFCPKTNQYKVLVIIMEWNYTPSQGRPSRDNVALIYTLGGLGGWRRIGNSPFFRYGTFCSTFMNNALHWNSENCQRNESIVSFNFESEVFHALPLPPAFYHWGKEDEMLQFLHQPWGAPSQNSYMSLGALRGHLCICINSTFTPLAIWVMKDYGVKESWSKEYDGIHTWSSDESSTSLLLYQPIDFLNNGDLLVYHDSSNALICIDKQNSNRYFNIGKRKDKTRSRFMSVAHVPSFVSLKDIMGDTLAVLNVRLSLTSSGPRKKIGERLFMVEGYPEEMLGWDYSDVFQMLTSNRENEDVDMDSSNPTSCD